MNKFFKIYTGDYSKDGYDNGINDSKLYKPKNGFSALKTVHPLNYVWKFSNSFDSYNKSYKKGYLDGQRVNHDIYSSSQKTGEVMSSSNQYEYHLKLIENLKQTLDTLNVFLENITQKYKQQLDAMESAGFYDNYIEPLTGKYSRFEQEIKSLSNIIEQHKAQIAHHEQALQELIEDARRNQQ